MAKFKKIIRFSTISLIVFVVMTFLCRYLFSFFWNFDMLSTKNYYTLYNFWEKGGVFRTFKDCSLVLSLIAYPFVWIYFSYKVYKKGLIKILTEPLIYIYRKITNPKNLEVEHVLIKNIGAKEKTLDEIISEKIGKDDIVKANTTLDIRKQIASKLEENEKQ